MKRNENGFAPLFHYIVCVCLWFQLFSLTNRRKVLKRMAKLTQNVEESCKEKNLNSNCQIKMQEHIVAHFIAIIQQSTQEIKRLRQQQKINKIEEIKMMKEKRTRVHLSNCKYTMVNPRNEKCFLSVNSTYLISHLQFYFVYLAFARVLVFFFCCLDFRLYFYLSNLLCLMAMSAIQRLKLRMKS